MTLGKARVTLFVVFMTCLFLQCGVVLYAFLKKRIYPDELWDLTLILIQIYSITLAIVIGGIFSGPIRSSSTAKPTQGYYFVVALVLVLAWNLLLILHSTTFG